MLEEYFADAGEITPANAFQHVYRLLLWIDPTTALAHCYESDKTQPGRPWYARSLAFHDWVSEGLGTTPSELTDRIDWLFKKGTEVLGRAITAEMERRATRVAEQRQPYEGRGMPKPGQDPALEQIIHEELGAYLSQQPSAVVLHRFTQRVRTHFSEENKRKNLVGEGFEDVLAFIIARLPGADRLAVQARTPLSRLPGFRPPSGTEKEKKVDVTIMSSGQHRTLVTAKWSVRADREEQFVSDFRTYAALETSGQDFAFTLVTNEFDAARLVAACERRRENAALFTAIVHVNPAGPRAVYDAARRGAAVKLHEHIERGRLISLEQWLTSLLPR